MKTYYVHTKPQSNGDHEVHDEYCKFLPLTQNRISLGKYANCQSAITAAKSYYAQVDGCKFCSPDCHKS